MNEHDHLMHFTQNVVRCSVEQAMGHGCDMFQLYQPGMKIGFSVRQGNWQMNVGASVLKSGQLDTRWTGFLLGTFNPLTERVCFFDCWECQGTELLGQPYRDRVMLMRTMQPYLPDWCTLAPSFRIADFNKVWAEQVVTGLFPGVIFRRSNDPATSPRLVCMKNPEQEAEADERKPS